MNTEDEIDQVLHTPENLLILNTSKWGHTQAVTVETKAALLQLLILEEVIVRRHQSIWEWIGTAGPSNSF